MTLGSVVEPLVRRTLVKKFEPITIETKVPGDDPDELIKILSSVLER
jgi:hypothetical protein